GAAALREIVGMPFRHLFERAVADPALEALETGLVGQVSLGQIAHCAPMRKIHKMPFETSRLLRQGLPRPSDRRGIAPMSGPTAAQCSSVKSISCCILLSDTAYHVSMR